jgi:hypothetical protein
MRAIGLSLVFALALASQVTSRYNAEIANMAAALADHNGDEFLAHFDRRMPGLDDLKANARALIAQADIHSGIDAITDDADGTVVDWIMDLTSRTNPANNERRRATVRLKFDSTGKHPKIVSLDPGDFFRPPRFAQ